MVLPELRFPGVECYSRLVLFTHGLCFSTLWAHSRTVLPGGVNFTKVASVNAFSFTGLQEGLSAYQRLFSPMTAALPLPRGLARCLPLVPFGKIQAEALATLPYPKSREAPDSMVPLSSKDQ